MLSSRERREKTSGTQKLEILWQNKSTSKIGVERVSLQCSAVAEADVFQRSHGMDPRFPDFQEMNLRPEELFKMWQELWRWIFLFWVLRLLTLLWEKRQLSTYGHQRCCWEFKDLSFCQPFSANSGNIPSQVNYVLCLLIAACLPGPSDHLPCAIPSAWRSGTWIFSHGDSYHLTTEEDTIPVNHCDPEGIRPSWCGLHLYFCPVLPRFIKVKSNSSGQIAEAILS